MKVVISGSEGFLGKHVVRALKEAGHEVLGYDLVLGHDILKPLAPEPCDAVIHLAAISAPLIADRNPSLAFDVNVNGTLQVLKFALASGAKKFVFSSSAHVYGISPRWMPTDESSPLSLGNTYTTTKILGEELCRLYHENHGLSYTTLRLYNAYGPGQAAGFFIPDQIKKAESGRINLQGANTTKDWIYASDVARAFALAVATPYCGELNICTGVETDLGRIAARIAAAAGAEFSCDPENHATTRMCGDNRRAKRVLGWEPKVTLEEGLDRILAP